MLRQTAQSSTAGAAGAVFSEEPVSLTTFVQDRRFLGNPPLSDVQFAAVRHTERIFYPHTYPLLAAEFEAAKQEGRLHVGPATAWREQKYWSEPVQLVNFITLQWGKGGGKDHVCRVASLRVAYLLLCLRSPQGYYGLPAQDTIHLLNVASSSGQAQQAFFIPITRVVRDSSWFADRCDPKQNTISFDKNVESMSGHSDAETQEGLNLLLGIADEIDAFKSRKEMAGRRGVTAREPTKSAEGILNMLRTSGSTRFPEVFKNMRISYPRFLGSTIQRLTAEARADVIARGVDTRHYVSGPLATWEVNPRVKDKDVFAADYIEDPVMARSKYECKPARAVNPYFRNHQAIDACFVPTPVMPLEVDYRVEQGAGSGAWIPVYTFGGQLYPIRGARYAMHADLAVTGDRAGVTMAHVVRYSEHETIAEDGDGAPHPIREIRPHVKVDFVISYEASASTRPPREIQIRWARQLAFELIRRGFNIVRYTFDSFQSRDSMQILDSRGIECSRVSTDTSEDPWRTLRDLSYEGRLIIPCPVGFDEPDAAPFLLRDELFSLTRMPNGRVDHPSDGSKDTADSLACAVFGAVNIGGKEMEDGQRAHYGTSVISVGGTFQMPLGVNLANVFGASLPGVD